MYLLALVLLIWHYAATRTDHVHRFELGSRKLVAAGGVSAPSPEVPGRIVSAPPKPVPERLGNMGAAVLVVGLGLHLVSIVLRGFATGRFPLGNMYEFVTMATAAATATGIVFLRGQTYRAMWVFLLAPVLILMFVAATLLYADAAPVVPALQSYWLPIHVTIVSIGSGVFLVSGVASLAFLLRIRQPAGAERRGPVGSMARRLPDAQTLDRWPTEPSSSASLSLVSESSSARSGRRQPGVGSGVGSQRDDVVYRLGDLRRLPPRPSDRRLARDQSRLDKHRRIRLDAVQSVHHQHGRVRIALLRRSELSDS